MMFFGLFIASFSSSLILFDKNIEDLQGKLNQPVNVYYTIANLGKTTVTDLTIVDSGIPRGMYDFSDDAANLKWKELRPGQNITHVFTVRPKVAPQPKMGHSRLTYFDGGVKCEAFSSPVFLFEVSGSRLIGAKENINGYLVFVIASALSICVPFSLWFLSRGSGKVKTE